MGKKTDCTICKFYKLMFDEKVQCKKKEKKRRKALVVLENNP